MLWLLILLCQETPLQLHPENPRYFLFRGKPRVLVTATEHYGSVLNRPFDFIKYLDDAAAHKMTLTRTFLLFRELQQERHPSSPCKPESTDFVTPFPRVGKRKAMDGEPMYDLDQWNPEYFERLHKFLRAASERGIVVELTLFSNSYEDRLWDLNPFNAKNNLQRIGKCKFHDYTSLKNEELLERELAYVRKIVQETCGYDNVYYEICNEAGGDYPGGPTAAEVDAWQAKISETVRDEMAKQGRKHLVFGGQAWSVSRGLQRYDESFQAPWIDAVNVHPMDSIVYGGKRYPMCGFMNKDLKLRIVHGFCVKACQVAKPCILDEDNAASRYRNEDGWTIHRKRAWMTVMSGGHYDVIDFSITVGSEASRAGIRTYMKHLSEYIHGFDFVHAKVTPDWISAKPETTISSALVVEGKDYVAYLADAREWRDETAGEPIAGPVSFDLPAGRYLVTLYSPAEGGTSPGVWVEGGKTVTVELAPFRHDVVIRATLDRSR